MENHLHLLWLKQIKAATLAGQGLCGMVLPPLDLKSQWSAITWSRVLFAPVAWNSIPVKIWQPPANLRFLETVEDIFIPAFPDG